jgi:OmpA-OmpF porin, OOP family
MIRRTSLLVVLSLVVLGGRTADAQSIAIPEVELERLELNPSGVGSVVMGSGGMLPAGSFRLSGAIHYERNPLLVFQNDVLLGSLISDRYTFHLAAAYAVHNRIELSLQLPLIAFQRGDDLSGVGLQAPVSGGIGMPTVAARIGILRSDDGAPFDLAAQVGVGIPVGSGSALARSVGVSVSPRLYLSKTISRFMGTVEGGATLRAPFSVGTGVVGHELKFGVGAVWTFLEQLRAEATFRSFVSLTRQPTSHELLVGARVTPVEGFDLFLLGGPGVGKGVGTPTYRFLLGAAFEHRPPTLPPGPVCVAGSPHDPAVCPDLDLDGDGIANRSDRCVREKEDADGFQDEDGCPEADNDGDTVLDAEDACPLVKGVLAFHGCPDRDGDGTEDRTDACPDQAGPAERKGCPMADADNDGVEDALDNCKTEPGPASNQGCPEKSKQLVAITKEKLVISEKVFFATARAKVLPKSFALLDQIVAVLTSHPEISHVDVEGHTDSVGSEKTNLVLSQKRAEAVRDYLVGKGIARERLSAKGFGPDRPADSNLTAQGRENNRRVEFTIPQHPDDPAEAPKPR